MVKEMDLIVEKIKEENKIEITVSN